MGIRVLWLCLVGLILHQSVLAKNDTKKDSLSTEQSRTEQKNIKRHFKGLDNDFSNVHYPQTLQSEFDDAYFQQNFTQDTTTIQIVQTAKSVFEELEATQNYVNLISPKDMVTLPIGVKKEIGTITYTLAIGKAKIFPDHMEVTAFVHIGIPQSDSNKNPIELFFGAEGIKISHKGGIYGDANLVLLGDIGIPINGGNGLVALRGGFDMESGNVANLTYVTIDCSGFKEMGIAADLLFPRSMLEPVDSNYEVIRNENVKVEGHFQTIVSDWNDILVEVGLPPFQLTKQGSTDGKGKAGLVFELNKAVFDFSDHRNSPNVRFSEGYQQYLIPGNEELWRGVYVDTFTVVLPEQFNKRNGEERVQFQASNLLVDGMGVSGSFSVDNILPLHEGNASKWQFSVDHIEAEFVTSNLIGAGFNGKIVLPVSKEVTATELSDKNTETIQQKTLAYQALIDPISDEYILSASANEALSFNVFKATATLTENSYVELKVETPDIVYHLRRAKVSIAGR